LRGIARVEEVVIRHGERLRVDGSISQPGVALSRGPFRAVDVSPELLGATLWLEQGPGLRPILLPLALGTAAALMATAGATTLLFHHWIGAAAGAKSIVSGMTGAWRSAGAPGVFKAAKIPRARWP
jgi:hypothetical protein